MTLGPTQVHPQQHLGEVSRVDATSLRTDGDDRLTLVILPGQQGANLESVDLLAKLGCLARRLRQGLRVIAISCELQQNLDVLDARTQPLQALDLSLQGRQPRSHPLSVLLVIPQVRGGHLFLEVRDLGLFGLGVENIFDRGQGCVELLDSMLKVYQCHVSQLYRGTTTTHRVDADPERCAHTHDSVQWCIRGV